MTSMPDIQEFYISGLPIETPLGYCHFIQVKEYPHYFGDLQVLALTKQEIITKYDEINTSGELDEFIDELHARSLFEIAHALPDVNVSYTTLFDKVFQDEGVFKQVVDEQSFNYYRSLIMQMNVIKEEKVNPNPEIQRAIERSRRVKSTNSEKLTFADMISSIVGTTGIPYSTINEFTLYQLYMTYYRIGHIKNYETSTLFATVSTENVQIDSWSKHVDLFEEDSHAVSQAEFEKSVTSKIDD